MSPKKVVMVARRAPAGMLVGLLRAYQLVISPMRGPSCRYYPSCSAYALTAIRRHGAARGFALAVWRVLRCNPWSKGGVDHVPHRLATMPRPGAVEEVHGVSWTAS
ncbi:MAG: membrane protein insertion efficiency factor YidD [Micrococcales bacterium]|nr:membrane protein insertion efficiency factor YidD [Micrococcales bacterium]